MHRPVPFFYESLKMYFHSQNKKYLNIITITHETKLYTKFLNRHKLKMKVKSKTAYKTVYYGNSDTVSQGVYTCKNLK